MAASVILVDTSAWIEYLRDTADPVAGRVASAIDSGTEIAITEPIGMELLAGATSDAHAHQLERLAEGLLLVAVDAEWDYRSAAQLFVASRRNGHPIRSLVDCLIAAVAIRRGIPVLQRDRDFGYLSEISPLALALSPSRAVRRAGRC